MQYNKNYRLKRTILGRLYLANQENGDVIDVNPITADIIEKIQNGAVAKDRLISSLCDEYDAKPEEISSDVEEILNRLEAYNVIY
jgi:hypothetical protein